MLRGRSERRTKQSLDQNCSGFRALVLAQRLKSPGCRNVGTFPYVGYGRSTTLPATAVENSAEVRRTPEGSTEEVYLKKLCQPMAGDADRTFTGSVGILISYGNSKTVVIQRTHLP